MTKIKILQIIDSLNVGGAEVLSVNIANSLADLNYESHICVTRKEGELKNQISTKVGYLFLNRKKTVDFKAIKKLSVYIKRNGVTTIHAHATSSFMGFCVKLLNPKVKLIWHDHYGNSEYLQDRKSLALRFFSRFFFAIISVNESLKLWAEAKLACPNVTFANNFVEFRDLSENTKLHGVDHKRIVMLAGFRPQKDHLNLLKAFKKIEQENQDWTLHLVGKLYNDAYSNKIIAFVEEHRLENKVYFYGVKSDVKFILNQSSIGVLSSKSEGLPLALLEYGLASLPVVITNVGECKKVLQDGKNGVLVTPENSEALYKGLTNLINSNKLMSEYSKNIHKEVLENYSKESMIDNYINIYEKC